MGCMSFFQNPILEIVFKSLGEGYEEGYGSGYEQGHDAGYEECRKLFNEYAKKIDISKLLNDGYEKWSKENEAILSRD